VLINTPFELVKCRQQINSEYFQSTGSVLKEIYKLDGLTGLYRGFCVSLIRDVPTYGLYFWIYYALKDKWGDSSFKLMTAGGISGVVTWAISYPFDTLKTIIQGQKVKMTQLQAFKIVQAERGIAGLFDGLKPALIRAYFANAIIFYTNEICHCYLD
jgi:solute carrier family 25 carnitine/acylcarnitine transporter 20/29